MKKTSKKIIKIHCAKVMETKKYNLEGRITIFKTLVSAKTIHLALVKAVMYSGHLGDRYTHLGAQITF